MVVMNMVGRGIDIKFSDEVRDVGGFYVICIELYELKRIDR